MRPGKDVTVVGWGGQLRVLEKVSDGRASASTPGRGGPLTRFRINGVWGAGL
jgi:hypothetical protein